MTRWVRAPIGAPETESLLPDGAALEPMRDLSALFPTAHLRKVVVARADDLDRRADVSGKTRLWLAIESLQATGSFKVRGAMVAIAALMKRETHPRVVAVSAGNHGAGVAYAANVLGCAATVVVPSGAPMAKRGKIAAYGCTIVVSQSPHYDDAEAEAKKLAAETGAHFLSPYDDLDVLLGNGASLGFEITRALGRVPDAVLVPFGGGGLASGMAAALAYEAKESLAEKRRVFGVQTDLSPAMARSLESGIAVERLESAPSLADGLEGGISGRAFARAKAAVGGVAVVSEAAVASAMRYAHEMIGLVIEGSAAVAIAPLFGDEPGGAFAGASLGDLRGGDVVCVLTGRNVDPSRLDQAIASSRLSSPA